MKTDSYSALEVHIYTCIRTCISIIYTCTCIYIYTCKSTHIHVRCYEDENCMILFFRYAALMAKNVFTVIPVQPAYCGHPGRHLLVPLLQVSAAHALLRFIMHTQRGVVPYLSSPAPFSHGRHMAINSDTRRALELVR